MSTLKLLEKELRNARIVKTEMDAHGNADDKQEAAVTVARLEHELAVCRANGGYTLQDLRGH